MDFKEDEDIFDEEDDYPEGPKQTRGDFILAVYGLQKQDACQLKTIFKPYISCTYRIRPRTKDDVALYLHFNAYKDMMQSKIKLHNQIVNHCRLTVEVEGNPVPPLKQEDKPKLAGGLAIRAPSAIKQMKMYSTMEFMETCYHFQVALKTQNTYADVQRIDGMLQQRCFHLRNTLNALKVRHEGLVCKIDRVVECEPSIQSAFKFMFLRRKAQGTGVITVGMNCRGSAIKSATLVKRHLPMQVVELTQILEKMVLQCEKDMISFLYKVYIYTNQSQHLMVVLESNDVPVHVFGPEIRHFFTKGPGKMLPIKSLRVMDSQTFNGGQNVVMGSPFIWEHIAGFQVQLTPSAQMWSDFIGAEKLCNAVASALGVTSSSVVLEIGCSSVIVGLHLSKLVKMLVSIDRETLVDLARMNSKTNDANITYVGGGPEDSFKKAVKLLKDYDSVSAVLTFTRYDEPDEKFIKMLQRFEPLRRLAVVTETDSVDKVILMLSEKCESTEPLLPVRMIPVDTMPNTKRYIVVVLLLRALDINVKLRRNDTPVYEIPELRMRPSKESQSRQRDQEERRRVRDQEERRRVRDQEERQRVREHVERQRVLLEAQERLKKSEERERFRVLQEEQERRRAIEEEEKQRKLEDERKRVSEEQRLRLKRCKERLKMYERLQMNHNMKTNHKNHIVMEEGHAVGPDIVQKDTNHRETQNKTPKRKSSSEHRIHVDSKKSKITKHDGQRERDDVDYDDDSKDGSMHEPKDRKKFKRTNNTSMHEDILIETQERQKKNKELEKLRVLQEEREQRRTIEEKERQRKLLDEKNMELEKFRVLQEEQEQRRAIEEKERQRKLLDMMNVELEKLRVLQEEREQLRALEEKERQRKLLDKRLRVTEEQTHKLLKTTEEEQIGVLKIKVEPGTENEKPREMQVKKKFCEECKLHVEGHRDSNGTCVIDEKERQRKLLDERPRVTEEQTHKLLKTNEEKQIKVEPGTEKEKPRDIQVQKNFCEECKLRGEGHKDSDGTCVIDEKERQRKLLNERPRVTEEQTHKLLKTTEEEQIKVEPGTEKEKPREKLVNKNVIEECKLHVEGHRDSGETCVIDEKERQRKLLNEKNMELGKLRVLQEEREQRRAIEEKEMQSKLLDKILRVTEEQRHKLLKTAEEEQRGMLKIKVEPGTEKEKPREMQVKKNVSEECKLRVEGHSGETCVIDEKEKKRMLNDERLRVTEEESNKLLKTTEEERMGGVTIKVEPEEERNRLSKTTEDKRMGGVTIEVEPGTVQEDDEQLRVTNCTEMQAKDIWRRIFKECRLHEEIEPMRTELEEQRDGKCTVNDSDDVVDEEEENRTQKHRRESEARERDRRGGADEDDRPRSNRRHVDDRLHGDDMDKAVEDDRAKRCRDEDESEDSQINSILDDDKIKLLFEVIMEAWQKVTDDMESAT